MNAILLMVLNFVIGNVTPELRNLLVSSIQQWEAKAAQTASPIDDIVVKVIKALLGIQ